MARSLTFSSTPKTFNQRKGLPPVIPIQAMNEAASSGLMETQTFREIFSQKTQEAAEEMLDELGAKMAGDVELVLEYQTVAPLLFERKALAHVRRKNPSLAGALPE